MIPHNQPYFPEEAGQEVYNLIRHGNLAPGDKVRAVESEWCRLTGAEDAAMVSSGVSALRLALLALNLRDHDEVIIPAYACTAIHNAVLAAGSNYCLADIKPDDLTINPEWVARAKDGAIKVIIAVHTFGAHADMELLNRLSGVNIIEDMSHGVFKQEADLAIASFGPTKFIGSCSGGIVSGYKQLIDVVRDLMDYGNKAPSALRQNDLPNEISAAIALEQLDRLEETINMRFWAAKRYDDLLNDDPKLLCPSKKDINYRYVVRVDNAKEVAKQMQAKGIMAHNEVIYDYRSEVDWPGNLPIADKVFDTTLSLPFWPDISKSTQEKVAKTLKEVLG